jgi:hypothetical protein
MTGRIVAATATCAAMALGVPAAHGAVLRSGCQSVATDYTGSRIFVGASSGYALFDDQVVHTMRCFITVDGQRKAATDVGRGTGAVTTAGRIEYIAPKDARVDLCTEIDNAIVVCGGVTEVALAYLEGSAVRTVCDALADHGADVCGSLPVALPSTQYGGL